MGVGKEEREARFVRGREAGGPRSEGLVRERKTASTRSERQAGALMSG